MWTETLGAAAMALALPGSAYLATLTAAAALPSRRPVRGLAPIAPDVPQRLAIVVPAHNESGGLLRTVHSLLREVATDPGTRIVVVADNCTDDTAAVARATGVEVLERHDPLHRGKGCALEFAFDTIRDVDWFIVIDADTDVDAGFLAAMRAAMLPGVDALQCRYGVRDPLASRWQSLADVALGAYNVLRPRGRAALGLSTGILGNGFALSRRALQAAPYGANSIVEDVEYHHLLVAAGLRVRWVDGTGVRGDMPAYGDAAGQQRARWEGGRIGLLRQRGPALLQAVAAGRWRMLDPLLDLMLLPLAWHVTLLLLAGLLAPPGLQAVAAVCLATVPVHLALALRLIRAGPQHLLALLGAPVYVAWKLTLAARTLSLSRHDAEWVRSSRKPL